jgi:uncharacterized protein (TIGR00369 family)
MTLIDKYRQYNNFGRLIDMDFKIIADGIVEYEMNITQAHLATPGAAHGGVISALVDGALGVAALSAVHKQNKIVSTIEFKLNFMAPALLNDRIVAKAKVDQLGNRIIVSSCEVICKNRDNKLLAIAIGTFNAYDAAKAGY